MEKIRAKFKCDSVTDYGHSKQVCLSAVTSGIDKKKKLWKYTPAGDLKMYIDNPEAAKMFKPGSEYYLDFIKV